MLLGGVGSGVGGGGKGVEVFGCVALGRWRYVQEKLYGYVVAYLQCSYIIKNTA